MRLKPSFSVLSRRPGAYPRLATRTVGRWDGFRIRYSATTNAPSANRLDRGPRVMLMDTHPDATEPYFPRPRASASPVRSRPESEGRGDTPRPFRALSAPPGPRLRARYLRSAISILTPHITENVPGRPKTSCAARARAAGIADRMLCAMYYAAGMNDVARDRSATRWTRAGHPPRRKPGRGPAAASCSTSSR